MFVYLSEGFLYLPSDWESLLSLVSIGGHLQPHFPRAIMLYETYASQDVFVCGLNPLHV